ncbi:MAG: quinolinate synthase NadA [Oscillospiraceae bacterium]|nr:quinolinate synthase NadA [Oscillospiraceae bacterium]
MRLWNMKNQIEQLKRTKNAVILAHYYAPAEVQEIADYVGDSFYLAKIAKQCDADIIVFCGVQFMGESAKILNPDKKVLMPDLTADCPMAHMVADGVIEEMHKQYADLAVVCYINSTAALKCKSDVCVTSSNAVKIVRSLPNQNIFFIPDRNLGSFVAEQVPEKNIILNDGCCPTHAKITAAQVLAEREKHPNAKVLTHPECIASVVEISDYIGSTADIIAYAKNSEATEFIICTEDGVDHKLITDNPDKRFYYPDPRPCCTDMKLNTLETVLSVLEKEDKEVIVDDRIRQGALVPLERMLELAK